MNHLTLQRNEVLRNKLAAEYVLGTLKGGARRRFARWMAQDAGLFHTVREWENRLLPMVEFAPSVQPPERVWNGIERRLSLRAAPAQAGWWQQLSGNLGFWRGLGVSGSAAAAVLVAVLVMRPAPPVVDYVATLADDKAQTAYVISGDAKRRTLTVRVVTAQQIGSDKSLELWAVPKSGAPRSLGLVAANTTVTLALPADVTPETTAALAVSLEPKGGSPNPNAPSGPVILKGAWLSV